jgi:hypothetical protein
MLVIIQSQIFPNLLSSLTVSRKRHAKPITWINGSISAFPSTSIQSQFAICDNFHNGPTIACYNSYQYLTLPGCQLVIQLQNLILDSAYKDHK